MRKFLFIFIAMFLTVPAAARVCILDNPAIMAAKPSVAVLSERLTAIEKMRAAEEWIPVWQDAAGRLDNISGQDFDSGKNGAWSVTANHGGTGAQTVSGKFMCSITSGEFSVKSDKPLGYDSGDAYCWCKMTSPRVGAWVFLNRYNEDVMCWSICAADCTEYILGDPVFRAAVLSLP